MITENEGRLQICEIGRRMYAKNFVDGFSGNISLRLDSDRLLVTPSGQALGFLQPDDLVIVSMDGQRVDTPTEANRNFRPTSEILMHLEVYKRRPDVGGVIHAHPQSAVALTVAGYDFNQNVIPEMMVFLGRIAVTRFANPSSMEDALAIVEFLPEHDVIMLTNHGSLTLGDDALTAFQRLECLEHNAGVLIKVEQMGGVRSRIAPDKLRLLMDHRENLGWLRPGDLEAFLSTDHA